MPNPSRASPALQDSPEISTATKPELSHIGRAAMVSEASRMGNVAPQILQKRVGAETEAQDIESQHIPKKARHEEQLKGQENENGDVVGRSRPEGSPMQPSSQQSYVSTPSESSTISALEPKTVSVIPDPGPASSMHSLSPQGSSPTRRPFSATSQDGGPRNLVSLAPILQLLITKSTRTQIRPLTLAES